MFESAIDPKDLDRQVRNRLAESLDHVFERVGHQLEVDPAQVPAVLSRIRESRIEPGIFARYFDLVFSIDAESCGKAGLLAGEILDLALEPAAFAIVPYSLDALGDDFERFPRLAFATCTESNPMAPPSEDLFSSHRKKNRGGSRNRRQGRSGN
jgi:hypothetical protein